MVSIGIIGAGQAGQRIAVALDAFPDVDVTAVVDPSNGRDTLASASSPWAIQDLLFFDDDDEMLARNYDGIVIAADPISAAHVKPQVLARNNIVVPVLWERPLGYGSPTPQEIIATAGGSRHSVVSFARYGLPPTIARLLAAEQSLGEIVDFELLVTLNCGLASKPWRQSGGVAAPLHLLDSAFEYLGAYGLDNATPVAAARSMRSSSTFEFEEKWVVSVELPSGVTGRLVAIQYDGVGEFLYPARSSRVIGTRGALVSAMGQTWLYGEDGRGQHLELASGDDSALRPATDRLVAFFRDRDGYPQEAACRGEALGLVQCLRGWIETLTPGATSQLPPSPVDDHARSLEKVRLAVDLAG